MRYEDTITLTRQGNSRCLVIPSKWLKLNNLERLNYAVDIVIEDGKITIEPTKSRYTAKQLEKETPVGTSLMQIKEPDKSMTPPDELPTL